MKKSKYNIPKEVTHVTDTLESAGFEAFLVGGCVRDLLLDREPKDWDVTTNANPEEIQELFPDSFYENDFGTVGVKTDSENETLKVVEVTPYRLETAYSDHRHPDAVSFSENIEDDLKRRDFTINAIALSKDKLLDPFDGQKDLEKKIIKTVGEPKERFDEDALRLLRAVRLAAELDFTIEAETMTAIVESSSLLSHISKERIRDEFIKIVMSDNPMIGLAMAQKMALLSHISTYLEETVGVEQEKQAHKYDVFEHSLRSLQHAADNNYSLENRLAALFHDIAKPQTKKIEKGKVTYFGHEVLGAKFTTETLNELKFPKDVVKKVSKLVRYHMFFADVDQITLSAVRRVITKVGKDNIWDLMDLRKSDRIGTGRPKEQPYRFRKYQSMVEEALRSPLSVTMLKVNGEDLMQKLNIEAGPKVGFILHALFEEVLEDPNKNTEEYLLDKAKELEQLPLEELQQLGKKGKEKLEEEDKKAIEEIKGKHKVK